MTRRLGGWPRPAAALQESVKTPLLGGWPGPGGRLERRGWRAPAAPAIPAAIHRGSPAGTNQEAGDGGATSCGGGVKIHGRQGQAGAGQGVGQGAAQQGVGAVWGVVLGGVLKKCEY